MIRPRPGDFYYSDREFESMKRSIALAKEIGFSGVVLGVLDPSRHVDCVRTRALVELANPLPVTFHRAFDQCPNLTGALESVIEAGAKRILTSGGKPSVVDALASVAQLVRVAKDRIMIMPGGGIRDHNIELILQSTGAREIHTSLNGYDTKLRLGLPAHLFEESVREFKRTTENVLIPPPEELGE
jgi:copper homeostasis protein